MVSFFIFIIILAIFFEGDFGSVALDTWLIILAISLSTDVQIFRWLSKSS